MPHKRIQLVLRTLPGLARVIRGHMVTAYDNVFYGMNGISHIPSAERIILPDSTILLDYILQSIGIL